MNPEITIRPRAVTPGGALLIGWSTAFIFLATIAVALRFVSRRLNHEVGADEWTILAGLIFAYGQYIANAILTCVVGFGDYQTKDLSISQFEKFLFVSDIFATIGKYSSAANTETLAVPMARHHPLGTHSSHHQILHPASLPPHLPYPGFRSPDLGSWGHRFVMGNRHSGRRDIHLHACASFVEA